MKLIIILAMVATSMAVPNQDLKGSSLYETPIQSGLRALMERVRAAMGTGVPSMGLPILDPYQRDSLKIKLDINNVLKMNASFEQFKVQGFQSFVVNTIDFSTLNLRFDANLTVPLLRIDADHYKLYADILGRSFLEIFGEGVAELEITNLDVVIAATLRIPAGKLNITRMTIDIKMGSVWTNLGGLMGGGPASDSINEILADLIPALVVYESEAISERLGGIGLRFANKYIQKLTLQDIIDIITGGSGTNTKSTTKTENQSRSYYQHPHSAREV